MLSLRDPGFFDPSSAFDSTLSDNNNNNSNNDDIRLTARGGSEFGKGGGSDFGRGGSRGGQDSTEVIGGGDGEEGDVGCASVREMEGTEESGGTAGVDGVAGDSDVLESKVKPRPMSTDEPEWDMEGDCIPLPAWKVRLFLTVYRLYLAVIASTESSFVTDFYFLSGSISLPACVCTSHYVWFLTTFLLPPWKVFRSFALL